jgi:predicted dehydrogenase/aryl-alcohol dehydrogenase-like predicted oxidoreductase
MSDQRLAWGILGTGRIAGIFAKQLVDSNVGACVAVGSREQASAEAFGDKYGVPRRHASYTGLLDDPQIDVVYITTPHPFHAEWTIKALEAGKHVLCEKPVALNHAQAEAAVEAARARGLFLMEAFMYRCHPQTARLRELAGSGAVGDVHVIQATHSFRATWDPASRLFDAELGGGGILDVGCYAVSMARLLAGAASGSSFAEPDDLAGYGRIGATGVDEYAVGVLRFPGEVVAQVATGVRTQQDNVVHVYGADGEILVPDPWFCGAGEGPSTRSRIVLRNAQGEQEIVVESDRGLYANEAEHVAACITQGLSESPLMSWPDSLGNMAALDRWRDAIGLRYPDEEPDRVTTATRRPLAERPDTRMPFGLIPGIDKPVSRLVLGRQSAVDMRSAALSADAYFEAGGNCFDTAHIYDDGDSERTLGRWIRNRGVRGEVVILGKGAHTPHCDPESIDVHLSTSLERMQTDYIDIYMLHRDNPEVPVGEFVDALNRQLEAGRIRAFGGSNWRVRRVQEANDWAATHGLRGFAAVSNQYSLARPLDEEIWPGCMTANDEESREWFTRTQTPLMPWSSQGRGFFVRGDPAYLADPELVRVWYSDDNFERLRRASTFAAERGVETVNVALAWVLVQPFPTFALIGPLNLRELNSSLRALEMELSEEEARWLELDDERADLPGLEREAHPAVP